MTASKPLRGIVRAMELWRVYRFARFVKKQNKSLAYESRLIAQFCLKKKRLIVKRYTPEQVMDIITYARKKDFLGVYIGEDGERPKLKISVPEGRKLLDSPFGTLQTFLSEYGLAISFLTGIFFTTVVLTFTGLGIRLFQFIIGLI